MITALHLFLWGLLLVVAYQDLRHRAISWLLIPALFITLITQALLEQPVNQLAWSSLTNVLFLAVQGIGLLLWYFIKTGRFPRLINQQMGSGDIWFLLVLTVGLGSLNFVILILTGIVFSLVTTLLYSWAMRRQTTVPLAGLLALWVAPWVGLPALNAWQWEHDWIITAITT